MKDDHQQTDPQDDELREAFTVLREDTTRPGAVPDFQGMLARARAEAEQRGLSPSGVPDPTAARRLLPLALHRRRVRRLTAAASLAAAAALAALFWANAPSAADREFQRLVAAYAQEVEQGALRSPTSALLRTPGLDLGAVPSFQGALEGFTPGTRPTETMTPDSQGRDS